MARIDSLLAIVNQQAANELRMGTDREPRMLAYGATKRLSIPTTPEDTLRDLLGDILSPEREQAMRAKGRIEVTYDAGALGSFQVTLAAREGGFDAVFLKGSRGRPAPAERPAGNEAPRPLPVPREIPTSASSSPAASSASPVVAAPLSPVHDEGASTSPLFAGLVGNAASLRASDLHLADGEPATVRVDGVLHRLDTGAAVDVASVLGLSSAERARLGGGDSLDFGAEVDDVGRVRVHVFQSSGGLAAAVRLLPRAAPSLGSLHLPLPLDDLAELPHGLVLVCGATGSGKSTTLAALAQEALRRRSIVLTTLEDPIEYALSPPDTSLLRRRQVGRDVRTFAAGLRDALREDPDVLLLGEMRDRETIGLALTAAETGHLVLSSLHSRSAASAVERIVDVFPGEAQSQVRVQLADALRAVVVQRLLPRARGEGRVPAIEVLRVTHAVGALIRDGKTSQITSTLQSGRREGMLSLERCLADKVQSGEIRLEDARAVANEPASLTSYLAK
jgi:twitching motility protein PilT